MSAITFEVLLQEAGPRRWGWSIRTISADGATKVLEDSTRDFTTPNLAARASSRALAALEKRLRTRRITL